MTPNPTSEVTQEDYACAADLAAMAERICFGGNDAAALRQGIAAGQAIEQFVGLLAAHRLAERNACAQRAAQILNSHPHAPPSPHEIIFAIRHPSGE